MTLRIQRERIEKYKINFNEYSDSYMITEKILNEFNVSYLMHPGPVNEGVEIDHNVVHGQNSVIQEQVFSGVAIRMAILKSVTQNKASKIE